MALMNMELEALVIQSLRALGIESAAVSFEHPSEISHGDYSTNVALAEAKKLKKNPREFAAELCAEIQKHLPESVAKAEVAGPGFINFFLSKKFFTGSVAEILSSGQNFGRVAQKTGAEKVMIEYTSPNPFKQLHIGHVMNNVVGEAFSRLIESGGAEMKRVTYHGDVGLHVAKGIWGVLDMWRESAGGNESSDESLTIEFLGKAYARGAAAYEDDEKAKAEITELNKKVYAKNDLEINSIYEEGRMLSLNHFKKIYTLLGSKFDHAFFESETASVGKALVESHIPDVFEKSDGAVVFRGEVHDSSLHTRVFINKEGIPTYEAKDIGLVEKKREWWHFDRSVTVTAEEMTQYFRVIKKVISLIFPNYAGKIEFLPHGTLRLPTGKMSSRTGSVIPADTFIYQIRDAAKERMLSVEKTADREIDIEKVSLQVALAAIKYSILKQAPGKDVIFDLQKSLSFEGDSGPYLQYAAVRASSVVEKALREKNIAPDANMPEISAETEISGIEKLLYRFPEVAALARKEYAPQYLVTYLTELASAWNGYYANTKIVADDSGAPYRVALAAAVAQVLSNGLNLLGIEVPEKM